jgi:Uma2 family endonuclease
MARDISNQVQYYYDFHPTEEDLMGENSWHVALINYLSAVLSWLFRGQACSIYENLNFYQTLKYREYPLAPDLAIIKGVPFEHVRSWTVGRTGPTPQVVFEILSEETWQKDVYEKPWKYARMGVQEYFAYDPYEPPISRATSKRLYGWRLDAERQDMVAMIPDQVGRLWSEQLQCWLVPDGEYLRLYDRKQRMCLTEAQAEALLKEQAAERAQEAQRAEEEAKNRAEEEARRAQEAMRQAELARRAEEEATRRAAEEARRAQALAEKLRALGINPDEVA